MRTARIENARVTIARSGYTAFITPSSHLVVTVRRRDAPRQSGALASILDYYSRQFIAIITMPFYRHEQPNVIAGDDKLAINDLWLIRPRLLNSPPILDRKCTSNEKLIDVSSIRCVYSLLLARTVRASTANCSTRRASYRATTSSWRDALVLARI